MIEIKKIRSKDLSYDYSVKISKDEVFKTTEECIKKFGSSVKISGFRDGHAPFDMVVKNYGNRLLPHVISGLIEKSYVKIADQDGHNIAITDDPDLNSGVSLDSILSSGFEVLLSFDVHPKINEFKLEKVTVEYKTATISDQMIEDELDYVSKMFGTKEGVADADYVAKDGDVVDINFSGYFADTKESVPNAQAENYSLELGSNSFIPGFEAEVVGHKIGEEFTIFTTFPEDYGSKDLAGKNVNFNIKINSISSLVKAKIDDELAKNLQFENLNGLRDNIRNRIQKSIDKALQGYILNAVCEKLGKEVEVSSKLLDKEFNNIKNNNNDLPSDDELMALIKKQMIHNYILGSLTKQCKIEITKEDLDASMTNEAFRVGKSVDDVRKEYSEDRGKFDRIYFAIQESKVFDKLMLTVNKKVENISYELFVDYMKDLSDKKQKIVVKA